MRNVSTRLIRAAGYYKSMIFQDPLKMFNLSLMQMGDYFLYYLRAERYASLVKNDTAMISSAITVAINGKGSILTREKMKLDYVDSADVFDLNYLDMLKLRVRYCEKIMPDYRALDKELLGDNKK